MRILSMEPPLQSLRLFLWCFLFFISASIFVDSQSQDSSITPPPPPPSPPSLSPPPPQFPPPRVRVVESNKATHEKHHRRKNWQQRRKPRNQNHHRRPRKQTLNTGKTVGLFFTGVAAALQVVVAGFLLFKRRQLLRKINDRH